jgi:hypothetical protein
VWGGEQYAWDAGMIRGLGVAGVVLLLLFGWWEQRAAEPILPLGLFRNPTFRVTLGTGFALGFAMFGVIVFFPVYLQVVRSQGATRSGLQLLPFVGGILVAALTCGQVISRIGRYKVFPVVGLALMSVGLYLCSRMGVTTSRPVYSFFMFVTGVGIGMCMPVLVLAMQNAVAHRDLGTATSALTFFRAMGGAFGVAAFGAIFNSRLGDLLGTIPSGTLEGVSPDELTAAPATIRALPAAAEAAVVSSYSRAIHTVFVWAVPVALVAWVIVWFLRETPLRDTPHVAFGDEAGALHEPEHVGEAEAGPGGEAAVDDEGVPGDERRLV